MNLDELAMGDYVQVLPSAPGRRDGFTGRCHGVWWLADTEKITAVDVWGGKPGHEMMRSVYPHRVRVLSARQQERLQARHETDAA